MKKAEIIQELDRLYLDMEPFVKYIKRYCVRKFKMERGFKEYSILKALYQWLKLVHENEFVAICYARGLVSEEMWANYKLLGLKDLQEQIIWAKALTDWKAVWAARYPQDENDGTNQGSDRKDQQVLRDVSSPDQSVQLQDSPGQDS